LCFKRKLQKPLAETWLTFDLEKRLKTVSKLLLRIVLLAMSTIGRGFICRKEGGEGEKSKHDGGMFNKYFTAFITGTLCAAVKL